MEYDIRLISSMEKVLPGGGILPMRPLERLTGFRGQSLFFQIAYCFHGDYFLNQTTDQATRNPYARVTLAGRLADCTRLRKVDVVPVLRPCEQKHDSEYLSDQPGLFPDVLAAFPGGVQMIYDQWRAIWAECVIPEDADGGDHPLEVRFTGTDGTFLASRTLNIHVVAAQLPPQRVIHTEWFHPDCLANYYGCEMFSERHWEIMENFMRKAVERGANMILTPIFTLPLDTLIGGERRTMQLVRVSKEGERYAFDFSLLRRWVELGKRVGFQYFEMSHLFSQWGAVYPPKVVAQVDGQEQTIFGWDTPVSEGGYPDFLRRFLPELMQELHRLDIADCTYFHVSDEPTPGIVKTYRAAVDLIRPYLEGAPIIDALGDVSLYRSGVVEKPVPGTDTIHDFLDAGMENGWAYYCVCQSYGVSNRFIAQPGWVTRMLGVQLYKYKIQGFLHWGYNFYNCQYSLHPIDPYRVNDAEDAFPAGDPFIVYPGPDGMPVESMRLPLMADAMYDVRLLELLESLTSREFVMDLVEQHGQLDLRFDRYPADPDYLRDLWETAAAEVEKRLA